MPSFYPSAGYDTYLRRHAQKSTEELIEVLVDWTEKSFWQKLEAHLSFTIGSPKLERKVVIDLLTARAYPLGRVAKKVERRLAKKGGEL